MHMREQMDKYNHLYPVFHIRKWVDNGGQVYDKQLKKENKCRVINYKKDFTRQFYYSLGKVDNQLEKRLSVFEHEVAPLIEKIDSAENNVQLTGKELELLKLYCLLCASRHENTCEVIKNDKSGICKSNNYLLGTFRNSTQEEAVGVTSKIVDDFERVSKMRDDTIIDVGNFNGFSTQPLSYYTIGLHLAVVRAAEPIILISDRFCIIENTMDSDHLYSYIPISLKTALLLVKSKYFLNEKAFIETKRRFGEKYGDGTPDEYLSDLFGAEVGDYENRLFCEYYTQSTLEKHIEKETNSIYIKINNLPKEIFRLFNSIYCEDGEKILFCDKDELEFALKHQLQCRDIVIE